MAVRLRRDGLSGDQINFIRNTLYIRPKVSYLQSISSLSNNDNTGETSDFPFFLLEGEDSLLVPLLFGKILLGVGYIPSVKPQCKLTFKGALRTNQVAPTQEALVHLNKHGATTIGLPPGSGKTVIGAYLGCIAGYYMAVLYHREIIGTQWLTTFSNFTDANCWVVGQNDRQADNFNVIICLDKRVHLIPKEIRQMIGFLIVDEAHAFCTRSHVECLLAFEPVYIVAETATLYRDDGNHAMIQFMAGTHGIISTESKEFRVIKYNTGFKGTRESGNRGIKWDVLVKSLLLNEARNKAIISLFKELLQTPGNKIMALTLMVEHVNLLQSLLEKEGIDCDSMFGRKKKYHDSPILLGTISKIGTGFDEENACDSWNGVKINVLVLCGSIKKSQQLEQNVGRAFRADMPVIYHLVDDDPTIARHWGKAQTWYKSKGATISSIG